MPNVNRRAPNKTHTQSVVFEKSAGWTKERARKWVSDHGYYTDGMILGFPKRKGNTMDTLKLDKKLLPVLYSLPLIETLELPPRAELLPKIESGEVEHIDFTARVFGTGKNRNPYLFNDADLPGFAASFEKKPFLRDHDTEHVDSRDGTILASKSDSGVFVQDVRLTTRRGMTDFLEGKMDRFSIGWFYDDVICTICNSSFFGANCLHYPGRKYQTDQGEKVCQLLFINPQGRETSAVNSPAVENTDVIGARLQEFKLSLLGAPVQEESGEKPNETEAAKPVQPVEEAEDGGQAAAKIAVTGEAEAEQLKAAAQARRAEHFEKLAAAESITVQGGTIMNIREIQAQRAAKITRARQLADLADGESRDFSETERIEWEALMGKGEEPGEVARLAEQIEKTLAEREKLRAAETDLTALFAEPEKPAPVEVLTMSRKDFNQLSAAQSMKFIKHGGKITE
jgi:hypothetical protein